MCACTCCKQDPDYIASEPLWIVKAKDKGYLPGMFGTPRQNKLVVEITEKRAPNNHRELIERIATHIKNNKYGPRTSEESEG